MELQKGDQDLVRAQNRALVVNLLRTDAPLSRADIARRTGLAPSVLSRLVRSLIDEGIACEIGKSTPPSGRPATLIELNPSYATSIGIKIERSRILGAQVDLMGTILRRAEAAIHRPVRADRVLEDLVGVVNTLVDGRVLGLGVSVSGFVEPATGTNLYSPILEWEDVAVGEALRSSFDLPVRVENDVNGLALAERWYGAGRPFQHFICITVGEGIGAGLVIGGELYRGAFGGAGELGHITIDPNGPVCRCRERGCLEVYASDRFLCEEAERLGFEGIDPLAAAAREGLAPAREAFRRMGANLGVGAKNLVNLLNPEAIILGGERMGEGDLFVAAFEEVVCQHSFPEEASRLRIVPAELGGDGFLIGAAASAALEFFRVPAQVTLS
ncbi:MAG: ROK family transcriptional regulator [Candidatus Bipolaricaulota bacterium]|nr:MAG: ROK family transcriptional regulator [Candidatus Bipolaricaulota bacterium]